MQREKTILENAPIRLKVKAEWDNASATDLTQKLFEYAERGIISFELNAKKGSLQTEFVITILEGLLSAFLYDVIRQIYNKLKKKKQAEEKTNPVYIFTEEREYIITGDKESKIPEELKRELSE